MSSDFIIDFTLFVAFGSVLTATVFAGIMTLLLLIIRPVVRRRLSHSLASVFWWFLLIFFMLSPLISIGITANTEDAVQTYMFAIDVENMDYYIMTSAEMNDEVSMSLSTFLPTMSNIWLVGMIFMACCFLIQRILLSRQFSDAKPFDGSTYNAYLKGIRRSVKMYTSARIKTPITYGVLKPRIVLPVEFSSVDSTLAEHAILHEVWHIRHFDGLLNMMWILLICVHWFNPLVWLSWFQIKKDMEFRCDAAVVKSLGYESKASYARALVELTPMQNIRPALSIPLSTPDIKARIMNVMGLQRPTTLSKVFSGTLFIIILCIFLASVTMSIIAVNMSHGISFSVTYRAGIGSAEDDYILFRLTKNNTYDNYDYELVGFFDVDPVGLSFNRYSFDLNVYGETLLFSFDGSDLVANGAEPSEWYKVIRKSSFETSNERITAEEALKLIGNLPSVHGGGSATG